MLISYKVLGPCTVRSISTERRRVDVILWDEWATLSFDAKISGIDVGRPQVWEDFCSVQAPWQRFLSCFMHSYLSPISLCHQWSMNQKAYKTLAVTQVFPSFAILQLSTTIFGHSPLDTVFQLAHKIDMPPATPSSLISQRPPSPESLIPARAIKGRVRHAVKHMCGGNDTQASGITKQISEALTSQHPKAAGGWGDPSRHFLSADVSYDDQKGVAWRCKSQDLTWGQADVVRLIRCDQSAETARYGVYNQCSRRQLPETPS